MRSSKFKVTAVAVLLSFGFCFAGWQDESKTIFEINDFDDFVEFRRLLVKEKVTFKGKEIHLKTDIIVFDTTDSDIWSQKIKPKDFERKKHLFENNILDRSIIFRGKFDGNGHYIRGLYKLPLFNNIENAEIKNLNIFHSYFLFASIAVNSKNSTIKNCNVSANVGGNIKFYLGGLCVFADKTTIINSSFNGNVENIRGKQGYVGGITGSAIKSSKLYNNNVSGIIMGSMRNTGGIAGRISSSSVVINNEVNSNIVEKIRSTFGLEYGYSFGVGNYGISNYDFTFLFGGAVINRHFSLSLGIGYQEETVSKTNGIKYNSDDYEKDVFKKVIKNEKGLPKDDILYNDSWMFMSIFLKPRFYLSEKSISPFIDADIGILGFSESSFYFNPSIGLQMRFFTISLGYKIRAAEYEKLLIGKDNLNLDNFIGTYESGGIVKSPNSAISLKIGFAF